MGTRSSKVNWLHVKYIVVYWIRDVHRVFLSQCVVIAICFVVVVVFATAAVFTSNVCTQQLWEMRFVHANFNEHLATTVTVAILSSQTINYNLESENWMSLLIYLCVCACVRMRNISRPIKWGWLTSRIQFLRHLNSSHCWIFGVVWIKV